VPVGGDPQRQASRGGHRQQDVHDGRAVTAATPETRRPGGGSIKPQDFWEQYVN
jgi:hypothetical protein